MDKRKVVISVNNTKREFKNTKYKLFFVNELCKDIRHDFKLFSAGGYQFERLFDFVSELIATGIFPESTNKVFKAILTTQLEKL